MDHERSRTVWLLMDGMKMNYLNWLAHHGVQGQKWGIRRGPPYPIDDPILKSGTELSSVRAFKDWTHSDTVYTYNPNDDWDSKVYKGAYSYYMVKYRNAPGLYEHRYEVVKDLKMPTKQERQDAFAEIYNANKKVAVKELKFIQDQAKMYNVGSEKSRTLNLKKIKTAEDYAAAYELFNHLMENANRFTITKKYTDLMRQNFDAMVDDNNQGIYNKAHDPIIIFRAKEALREIGEARMLDVNEVMTNLDYVRNELANEGLNVKL